MAKNTIKLKKSELMPALVAGGMYSGKSKVLQIMSYIKVTVSKGRIGFQSTDMQSFIKAVCDIDSGDDMSFLVEYEHFKRILALINQREISLVVDTEDRTLRVEHEGGFSDMPILGTNDFPAPVLDKMVTSFTVGGPMLAEMVSCASRFVASPETNLGGVDVRVRGSELVVMASDKYKLYIDRAELDNDTQSYINFIIPQNSFKSFIETCQYCDEVSVSLYEGGVLVSSTHRILFVRTSESAYPDLSKIVDVNPSQAFTVKKKIIESSLKRLELTSSVGLVSAHFGNGELTMSSSYTELATCSNERIDCECDGEVEMLFCARFMIDSLSVIDCDDVNIYTNGPLRPIVMRGKGKESRTVSVIPAVNVKPNE